jgi:hypothetical protein
MDNVFKAVKNLTDDGSILFDGRIVQAKAGEYRI